MVGRPASAALRPLPGEWWFSVWGIEKYVWPQSRGAGVTVAVLDSGVNASLPELAGVVLKGTDTTGRKGDGRQDFDDKEGGHGTGLSALIAGQGGGSTGYVGVAPDAKILPVHVTAEFGDSVGLYEAMASGIRFAVDHKAGVINISQGITSATWPDHCDPGVQDAIAYAVAHDVIVVASSGNEGNTTNWPELPGSCAGVVAVGGVDKSLRPWSGTQRQSYVAVAAPGVGPVVGETGRFAPHVTGTSLSAALVSAAIAIIRSHNPRMPARTVVQRLMATAYHPKAPAWNDQTGYGPIQITSAMNAQRYPVPADAPNPVYARFDEWQANRYGTAPRGTPEAAVRRSVHSRNTGGGAVSTTMAVVSIGGAIAVLAVVLVIVARRRAHRSRREFP
ncbi:S8 family serine peptidase [Actinoallomurus sp. NBC_01490]|uniref:S8 family serine peptidase n=1 Tax=Actinoallomurus sp. NBC_01490 TaxID=2903557 RepID=UPI002E37E19C|nr:S8 family serine peptidase [Actinoallomurus sp. NBC_01490]